MSLSIPYDIHRLTFLNVELIEDALEGQPINGTEYALYSAITSLGRATISEVSTHMAVPLATTSKMIAKAEDLGHISRAPNPEDGRSQLVELTRDGKKMHEACTADFMAALRRLLDELGGSRDDIKWALRRLDSAYRSVLGFADDPPVTQPTSRSLGYGGRLLTREQEEEVRAHIEFVQWRDSQ